MLINLFHPLVVLSLWCFAGGGFLALFKYSKYGFWLNLVLLGLLLGLLSFRYPEGESLRLILCYGCPLLLINTALYVFFGKEALDENVEEKYRVNFKTAKGKFSIANVRRGVSIIGAAGSGKTESVVYPFLQHFRRYNFSGVIHDYKDFELTEMAYPLFKDSEVPFYIISFDKIVHRVNPIAPRYLPNEESVNEVSRVLLENLLEQKESGSFGASKFFNDAVEGLIGGIIWRLRTDYQEYCTLPHLIAIYQLLDTDSLIAFLSGNQTSKAMASAFIQGKDSERQTAGVKSTLANALKKITTEKIFYVLSGNEVPLDINNPENPAVISMVNNPKYDSAYSPIIATIMHTIIKQMSTRNRESSFVLMEEAPTIRLLNMHRVPATLRSYDIATLYVMQDKIQNDLMYGEKASKAILSNLSYQFFGKANDPDTARYYERFFELVKQPTTSVNRSHSLDFDTRVTTGEREVAKIRASRFFTLKPGEFVVYADGEEKVLDFKLREIKRTLFTREEVLQDDVRKCFDEIFSEIKDMFES
ncbi:type IV secretory system conjugative DNA transfer family protein [Autumnicola musiva]|uniref:Type IV secretory system conjugative DNA transfer family protein n=1 Tax=Autumnicola musiva TaxID=3075589 RepID=A0ABU3D8Q8_9FLAO|nr:type IV secretory system conjugative DNA transfer family protein [Zunongwangia sp. F117]MDT0677911.1 type IV secretory system conjugative DNA transfer family protein [Zunongwangia sp. F117]